MDNVPIAPQFMGLEDVGEQGKLEVKKHLLARVPRNTHPLPKGLSCCAQVLIHKARTEAALAGDVLAWWRTTSRQTWNARNTAEKSVLPWD